MLRISIQSESGMKNTKNDSVVMASNKNKLSRMMVKMVVKLTSELRLDIVLLL